MSAMVWSYWWSVQTFTAQYVISLYQIFRFYLLNYQNSCRQINENQFYSFRKMLSEMCRLAN